MCRWHSGQRRLVGAARATSPTSDATIVTRMLDAGAEIVATLNMDDFALSGDGLTSLYGPSRNPHNPEYCAGGSSCGSARGALL